MNSNAFSTTVKQPLKRNKYYCGSPEFYFCSFNTKGVD